MQPQNAPVVDFFHGTVRAAVMFAMAVTVSVSSVAATASTGHAQTIRGGENFILYFEDTPLGEVLDQISALTELDLSIDEAYAGLPVNGELDDLVLTDDPRALLRRLHINDFDLAVEGENPYFTNMQASGQSAVIRIVPIPKHVPGSMAALDTAFSFTTETQNPVLSAPNGGTSESDSGKPNIPFGGGENDSASLETVQQVTMVRGRPVKKGGIDDNLTLQNVVLDENPVVTNRQGRAAPSRDFSPDENPVLKVRRGESSVLRNIESKENPVVIGRDADPISPQQIEIKENPVLGETTSDAVPLQNVAFNENPVMMTPQGGSIPLQGIALDVNPVVSQSLFDGDDSEALQWAGRCFSADDTPNALTELEAMGLEAAQYEEIAGRVIGAWETAPVDLEGEYGITLLVENEAGEIEEVLVSDNTPIRFLGGALSKGQACQGRRIQAFIGKDSDGFNASALIWVSGERLQGPVVHVDEANRALFVEGEAVIIEPGTFIVEAAGNAMNPASFESISAGDDVDLVGLNSCTGDTGLHAIAILKK